MDVHEWGFGIPLYILGNNFQHISFYILLHFFAKKVHAFLDDRKMTTKSKVLSANIEFELKLSLADHSNHFLVLIMIIMVCIFASYIKIPKLIIMFFLTFCYFTN